MRCSTPDKAADEERNAVFRRREEENGQTQPQLYGTYYFSVRKTLTGQLEREEDCVAFQAALLELLRRVPLTCPAERWVTDHWLYFYECSVGCIGILKDWLLRAVSAALDDDARRLSLDCVQDYALPVEVYRQMALDAYEGEQRLNHTEANREHVWRLLQGGELIAPVPPLPPRDTPTETEAAQTDGPSPAPAGTESVEDQKVEKEEAAPSKPAKKTPTRQKVEAQVAEQEADRAAQAEEEGTSPTTPAKRGRKKRTADETDARHADQENKPAAETSNAREASTDAPTS